MRHPRFEDIGTQMAQQSPGGILGRTGVWGRVDGVPWDQRREGVSPWVSAGSQWEELLLEPILAPLSSGITREGTSSLPSPSFPSPLLSCPLMLVCIVFSNLLWNVFREMKSNPRQRCKDCEASSRNNAYFCCKCPLLGPVPAV